MNTNHKGYYDIDIDIEKALLDSGMVDEIFYLKDLKQRKLFLNTDVEQLSVGEIVKHIMQYNKEDIGIETVIKAHRKSSVAGASPSNQPNIVTTR